MVLLNQFKPVRIPFFADGSVCALGECIQVSGGLQVCPGFYFLCFQGIMFSQKQVDRKGLLHYILSFLQSCSNTSFRSTRYVKSLLRYTVITISLKGNWAWLKRLEILTLDPRKTSTSGISQQSLPLRDNYQFSKWWADFLAFSKDDKWGYFCGEELYIIMNSWI